MGSARIAGNKLVLKLGATDYFADAIKCKITNDEATADVVTFEDAASGGSRQFYLDLSAIQSTAAASLWRLNWDSAGTEIDYVYAPHGNAVASITQPHFTGKVKIGPKPEIGGDASATGRPYTFDGRWPITGTPVLKTT